MVAARHAGRPSARPVGRRFHQVSLIDLWLSLSHDMLGDVSLLDGEVGVGQERVIPPAREQGVGEVGVLDVAHHQAGGDPVGGRRVENTDRR